MKIASAKSLFPYSAGNKPQSPYSFQFSAVIVEAITAYVAFEQ